MANTMQVDVVAADQHLLTVQASEVYARSVVGEFAILPGHQPGLFALDVAPVRIVTAEGRTERFAVHRGVLYVDVEDHVIVLADMAERAEDIDVARAEQRLKELEAELAQGEDATLRLKLRRQQVRLQLARV